MVTPKDDERRRASAAGLDKEGAAGSADARRPSERSQTARPASSKRLVIMVVDDDLDTQSYMTTILARSYDVVSALRSSEMWHHLETQPGGVNVILMDLSLAGGEDGIQLVRQLRTHQRWRSIPVVALTAHASDEVRDRAFAAGCDEYVSKPIDRRSLFGLIDTLVARASAEPNS